MILLCRFHTLENTTKGRRIIWDFHWIERWDFFQILHWWCDLNMCCTRATSEDGNFAVSRRCFLNKKYRDSLRVCILPIEGQYVKQTSFSNLFKNAVGCSPPSYIRAPITSSPSAKKLSTRSFFPWPVNLPTVSHPVKACRPSKTWHFSLPSLSAMFWIANVLWMPRINNDAGICYL